LAHVPVFNCVSFLSATYAMAMPPVDASHNWLK
jgi:hypothetical protein